MPTSDIEMESAYYSQQIALPIEMILKIISKFKSIEDIRNCMLLSKEIKHLMLKSLEIMRNIKIQSNCFYESETAKELFTEHGRFIRCLSILAKVKSAEFIKDLLILVPNLEEFRLERRIVLSRPTYPWSVVYSSWLSELTYKSDSKDNEPAVLFPIKKKLPDCWNCSDSSLDMTKLKALKIDVRDLEYFLIATKNVKNLEKLTIFPSYTNASIYEEFMFDFICQQDKLKELNLISKNFGFPEEVQISNVKFKLKRFKLLLTRDYENKENFTNFLAIHAESLEELEVDHSLSPRSLQLIFERFHKLQKLTLKSNINSEIYSRNHPNWILPNIKHFDDQNSFGINLDKVLKRFPNIESLKCQVINDSSRKFHKIIDLEVNTWNPICFCRDEIMRYNISNVKNIEHLAIRHKKDTDIVKYLGLFEKLKTFSCSAIPYEEDQSRRTYRMGGNEKIPTNYMFYDIMADMDKKILKVSMYIAKHEKKIYNLLVENFKGFHFHEFR